MVHNGRRHRLSARRSSSSLRLCRKWLKNHHHHAFVIIIFVVVVCCPLTTKRYVQVVYKNPPSIKLFFLSYKKEIQKRGMCVIGAFVSIAIVAQPAAAIAKERLAVGSASSQFAPHMTSARKIATASPNASTGRAFGTEFV